MAAFGDRPIVYHAFCTDAVRATKTWAATELVVVVDGGGVPTGEIYLGDGSTAGGLGPFMVQADMDGRYALLTGAAFSGAVSFEDGVTMEAGLTTLGPQYRSNVAPLEVFLSTSLTDAAGGRASTEVVGGYTAAGALHYLMQVVTDHDGAAADQKARWRVFLNDGSDGLVPTLFATYYGATGLADFAGEVRTPVGRVHRRSRSTSLTVNNSAATVTYDTSDYADTGVATYSAGEFTLDFTGRGTVKARLLARQATGTRTTVKIDLEKYDGVSAWDVVVTGGVYCRDSTTDHGDTIEHDTDVTSGDKYRVRVTSTVALATATIPAGAAWFKVERRQSSS